MVTNGVIHRVFASNATYLRRKSHKKAARLGAAFFSIRLCLRLAAQAE